MTTNKIIITGGANRIGAAIAKSLADYETTITIHYNKSKTTAFKLKNELESLGSEVYLLNYIGLTLDLKLSLAHLLLIF